MILKVTALKHVVVNDPVGIETVSPYFGNPIIQLKLGDYREYNVLDQQGNRLIPPLDAAAAKGLLTYEVVQTSGNSEHYRVNVTFQDVTGSKLVGEVLAGSIVRSVVVRVTEVFDGATELTVGDSSDNDRLMESGDNFLTQIGDYETFPHHLYVVNTPVNVYLPSGSPTQGAAEVIVYVSSA